jgi:aryl-alcohol dehydrogenase-like predicted oxidoreductase
MKPRKLGRNGPAVAEIGLGCMVREIVKAKGCTPGQLALAFGG